MRAAVPVVLAVTLAAGTAAAQNVVQPTGQYSTAPGGQYSTAPAPQAGTASTASTAGTGSTQQQLDQSEQNDSGRGLELFYARVDAGFSYQNLTAFSGSDKIGLATKDAVGAAFGAGAGVRLFLFTLGVRGRLHTLSAFNLWQANAVLGLHVPISSLDLYGELYGGYSAANSFGTGSIPAAVRDPADQAGISAQGGNVGVGLGLDYYLNPHVSLGGGVTGETLLLVRNQVDAPSGSSDAVRNNSLFADSAAVAGVGVVASLRLGLHLGL